MRILVVDDDSLICLIVRGGLKALGHEVVACESGAQAWSILRESQFQLLVTDWSMPEMDGIELTQMVRKVPRAHCWSPGSCEANGVDHDGVLVLQAGARQG